jgi:hypothetical protein
LLKQGGRAVQILARLLRQHPVGQVIREPQAAEPLLTLASAVLVTANNKFQRSGRAEDKLLIEHTARAFLTSEIFSHVIAAVAAPQDMESLVMQQLGIDTPPIVNAAAKCLQVVTEVLNITRVWPSPPSMTTTVDMITMQ